MSEDPSKLMGSLMLKGWAMTAECCDVDFNPLMKDMKNKGSICVSCQNDLAKLIVSGCKIVAQGTLFFAENDTGSVKQRLIKHNGIFKLI